MVKLSLEVKKRDFVWISLIVVLVGVGFVVAAWDSNKAMFHNSEDVKVTIDSVDYSLQEALDDGLIGGGMSFGDWTNKDSNGVAFVRNDVYQASSDGLVTMGQMSMWASTRGYTDSSSTPTTLRSYNYGGGVTFPVKKDDYWRITVTHAGDIYWLPIVSGGGSGGLSCTTKTCITASDETCTVTCDVGDTLSGGGVKRNSGSGTIDWMESYPDGNGWTCGLDDKVSTCYAICC